MAITALRINLPCRSVLRMPPGKHSGTGNEFKDIASSRVFLLHFRGEALKNAGQVLQSHKILENFAELFALSC